MKKKQQKMTSDGTTIIIIFLDDVCSAQVKDDGLIDSLNKIHTHFSLSF